MCLPLKCLKTVVIFFAIITILASIAAIAMGIYTVTKDTNQFWKNTEWQSYVYGPVFLIILGVFILIIGLFGAIGASKKNGCCIFIYNLGNIPLSALFIVLGIVVAAVFVNQKNSLDQFFDPITCAQAYIKGKQFKWISDANTNFVAWNAIFGQDNTHQIYIKDSDSSDFKTYMATIPNTCATQSSTCKSNVLDWLPADLNPTQTGSLTILKFFESTLKCSGVCNIQQYYVFSDVNKGFTKDHNTHTCIYELKGFLDKFGKIVYITCFCIGAILFLNAILSFCICCHPKKKNKGGNIYVRMSYTEDDD